MLSTSRYRKVFMRDVSESEADLAVIHTYLFLAEVARVWKGDATSVSRHCFVIQRTRCMTGVLTTALNLYARAERNPCHTRIPGPSPEVGASSVLCKRPFSLRRRLIWAV